MDPSIKPLYRFQEGQSFSSVYLQSLTRPHLNAQHVFGTVSNNLDTVLSSFNMAAIDQKDDDSGITLHEQYKQLQNHGYAFYNDYLRFTNAMEVTTNMAKANLMEVKKTAFDFEKKPTPPYIRNNPTSYHPLYKLFNESANNNEEKRNDAALIFLKKLYSLLKGFPHGPLNESYPSFLEALWPYGVSVKADGLTALHLNRSPTTAGMVIANTSIPLYPLFYYFEVTLLTLPQGNDTEGTSVSKVVVGIIETSDKYRAIDGDFNFFGYSSHEGSGIGFLSQETIGPSFNSGDTIGCLINLTRSEIAFTKNGDIVTPNLQLPHSRKLPYQKLESVTNGNYRHYYPAVLLGSTGAEIEANFGCPQCSCLSNGALGLQLLKNVQRDAFNSEIDKLYATSNASYFSSLSWIINKILKKKGFDPLSEADIIYIIKATSCICLFFGMTPYRWMNLDTSHPFHINNKEKVISLFPPHFKFEYLLRVKEGLENKHKLIETTPMSFESLLKRLLLLEESVSKDSTSNYLTQLTAQTALAPEDTIFSNNRIPYPTRPVPSSSSSSSSSSSCSRRQRRHHRSPIVTSTTRNVTSSSLDHHEVLSHHNSSGRSSIEQDDSAPAAVVAVTSTVGDDSSLEEEEQQVSEDPRIHCIYPGIMMRHDSSPARGNIDGNSSQKGNGALDTNSRSSFLCDINTKSSVKSQGIPCDEATNLIDIQASTAIASFLMYRGYLKTLKALEKAQKCSHTDVAARLHIGPLQPQCIGYSEVRQRSKKRNNLHFKKNILVKNIDQRIIQHYSKMFQSLFDLKSNMSIFTTRSAIITQKIEHEDAMHFHHKPFVLNSIQKRAADTIREICKSLKDMVAFTTRNVFPLTSNNNTMTKNESIFNNMETLLNNNSTVAHTATDDEHLCLKELKPTNNLSYKAELLLLSTFSSFQCSYLFEITFHVVDCFSYAFIDHHVTHKKCGRRLSTPRRQSMSSYGEIDELHGCHVSHPSNNNNNNDNEIKYCDAVNNQYFNRRLQFTIFGYLFLCSKNNSEKKRDTMMDDDDDDDDEDNSTTTIEIITSPMDYFLNLCHPEPLHIPQSVCFIDPVLLISLPVSIQYKNELLCNSYSRTLFLLRESSSMRQATRNLILGGHCFLVIEFLHVFLPLCFLQTPLATALVLLLRQQLFEFLHPNSTAEFEALKRLRNTGDDENDIRTQQSDSTNSLSAIACRLKSHLLSRTERIAEGYRVSIPDLNGTSEPTNINSSLTSELSNALYWVQDILGPKIEQCTSADRLLLQEACSIFINTDQKNKCYDLFGNNEAYDNITEFYRQSRLVTANIVDAYILEQHLGILPVSPLEIGLKHLIATQWLMRIKNGNIGPILNARSLSSKSYLIHQLLIHGLKTK